MNTEQKHKVEKLLVRLHTYILKIKSDRSQMVCIY